MEVSELEIDEILGCADWLIDCVGRDDFQAFRQAVESQPKKQLVDVLLCMILRYKRAVAE